MSKAETLIIGIDLGTTNAKVACFDLEGIRLASASRSLVTYYPRPGWYEQNPDEWLIALEDALNEVVYLLGDHAPQIKGISLSSFGPGMVMVKDGYAIAPCPTWQDKRSWDQGRRLIDELGLGWIGFGIPQTGFPARVLYAIEEEPELISQAEEIYDIKAFIMNWLTGIAVTDPSSGPGADGWNSEAFNFINWPIEKLPQVKQPSDFVGVVRVSLAEKVGLPKNIPVFVGLNDGAAATVGSGVVNSGDCIITLATNGVIRLVIPDRLDSKNLFNLSLFSWPFIDNLWICGGSILSGAGSLQWFAELLGVQNLMEAYDDLLEEASRIPLGSRGVVFLPYLSGRGSPLVDTNLRGGFIHLGIEHGRGEMVRSLLEGITFALKEIFNELKTLGLEIKSIRLTGGGARSELWKQIVSEVMDSQVVHAGGDATLGSAMVASVGLGYYSSYAEASKNMVHLISQLEPDSARSNAYQKVYKYFSQSRDALLTAPPPCWNWQD